MDSIFQTDFMIRKRQEYFSAIHALNDEARLPNNMYGYPIKCYICDCSFHVNKYCIKATSNKPLNYNKNCKDIVEDKD